MSTVTTTHDAELDVDAILDAEHAVAFAELESLAFSICRGEKISGQRLNHALFNANMSREEFKAHLANLRHRKQGEADLKRADQLDAEFARYVGPARALIAEHVAMAEHFARCHREALRAADYLRQRLIDRQSEGLSLRQRAMLALRVRRSRSTEQTLRNLSQLILEKQRIADEIDADRRRFSDDRWRQQMAETLESLRDAAQQQRLRTGNPEPQTASRLADAEREFERLSGAEAAAAKARAELERLRELQREVSAKQHEWQSYDLDRGANETGTPLPPAAGDATDERLIVADQAGAVFKSMSEVPPVGA